MKTRTQLPSLPILHTTWRPSGEEILINDINEIFRESFLIENVVLIAIKEDLLGRLRHKIERFLLAQTFSCLRSLQFYLQSWNLL